MKHLKVNTEDLVKMYTEDHLTLRKIGSKVGMSAVAVHKRLKKVGVTGDDGEWVTRECAFCGDKIRKHRSLSKRHPRSFCNSACYHASMESPGYKPWRGGQRLARALISKYFKVEPDMVIHFKDGDSRNHDIANLAVSKFHEGYQRKIEYIWEGDKCG